jgi:hypothetical protein
MSFIVVFNAERGQEHLFVRLMSGAAASSGMRWQSWPQFRSV